MRSNGLVGHSFLANVRTHGRTQVSCTTGRYTQNTCNYVIGARKRKREICLTSRFFFFSSSQKQDEHRRSRNDLEHRFQWRESRRRWRRIWKMAQRTFGRRLQESTRNNRARDTPEKSLRRFSRSEPHRKRQNSRQNYVHSSKRLLQLTARATSPTLSSGFGEQIEPRSDARARPIFRRFRRRPADQ